MGKGKRGKREKGKEKKGEKGKRERGKENRKRENGKRGKREKRGKEKKGKDTYTRCFLLFVLNCLLGVKARAKAIRNHMLPAKVVYIKQAGGLSHRSCGGSAFCLEIAVFLLTARSFGNETARSRAAPACALHPRDSSVAESGVGRLQADCLSS